MLHESLRPIQSPAASSPSEVISVPLLLMGQFHEDITHYEQNSNIIQQ